MCTMMAALAVAPDPAWGQFLGAVLAGFVIGLSTWKARRRKRRRRR